MLRLGIIAEGNTDQQVLENILLGYFEDREDEPVIRYIQPMPDAFGGWHMVFEYFKQGTYKKDLSVNDYLVVQLDTDVSESQGYEVSKRGGDRELSPEELVTRVIKRLKEHIEEGVLQEHGHKFIFAISVDEIECWLLPLLHQDKKAAKTTGCLNTANHALKLKNERPLSNTKEEKNPRAYQELSRSYSKKKELLKRHHKNPSLKLFIESLDRLFMPSIVS